MSTIFQRQRQSQGADTGDDSPDVTETEIESPGVADKPPLPELYKGQIWANADGSIARKIVQIRRNRKPPWKVVWVSTGKSDEDETLETISTIDEFLFWAMRHEAVSMMARYQ